MKFDCVVIIDCWSIQQQESILKEENKPLDWQSHELKKCKTYYQEFSTNLNNVEFDNILHALYPNEYNGDLLNRVEQSYDTSGIPEEQKWMYRTHPLATRRLGNGSVNSLTTDCAVPDDIKRLTDGKKILVCGRSFGACVHGRPVGIVPLLNLGFEVYIRTELVLKEGYRPFTEHKHVSELNAEDLIDDDVVWTQHREMDNDGMNRRVPDVFKAVAVHRNSLIDHQSDYTVRDDRYFI